MDAHTAGRTGDLDTRGERAAAFYAERAGARVLARNWRGGGGELDLVLDEAGTLVFCEVKTRASASYGSGFEAVTRGKQKRIARAALVFLAEHRFTNRACRFDVAVVEPSPDGETCSVKWMRAAFDAPPDEELDR